MVHQLRTYRSSHPANLSHRNSRNYEAPGATLTNGDQKHAYDSNLVETGGGNFLVPAFPGLIVKDSYWRWPERNQSGNAIDFLVQVLGRSFHDAMTEITTP